MTEARSARARSLPDIRRIGGVQCLQALGQGLCDDGDVMGIEVHVGIALRMDIAHAAIHRFRYLQHRHRLRRQEVEFAARLDAGISRLLQEARQPARLQAGPGAQDKVGLAHLGDEAGAGTDMVRVLPGMGCGVGRNVFAADRLRQGGPLRLAG